MREAEALALALGGAAEYEAEEPDAGEEAVAEAEAAVDALTADAPDDEKDEEKKLEDTRIEPLPAISEEEGAAEGAEPPAGEPATLAEAASEKPATTKAKRGGGTATKCPKCGARVARGAKKCRKCKTKIKAAIPAAPAAAATEAAEPAEVAAGEDEEKPLTHCPECGARLAHGAKRCRKCKAKIVQPGAKRGCFGRLFLLLAIFLLLAAAAFAALAFTGKLPLVESLLHERFGVPTGWVESIGFDEGESAPDEAELEEGEKEGEEPDSSGSPEPEAAEDGGSETGTPAPTSGAEPAGETNDE